MLQQPSNLARTTQVRGGSPRAASADAGEDLQALLKRGRKFSVYAEEILGVRFNKAQRRVARVLDTVPADGSWPLKELVVVAANQIGKTFLQAIIMSWACLYKIGVDPADQKAWIAAPYLWIHLGPVQQQAYHAQKDLKMLLLGEHPAQVNGSKLPPGLISPSKIENYYDGFTLWNGSIIMFRTGERKAEAVLGYRAAAISVDEAAFFDYLTETKNTVLMMRLVASGGPLFMFSTPNGMNDFFDQADAIKTDGRELEDMVWGIDGRYLVWAIITDNEGYGLSSDEIARMEAQLNPATREQQLRGAFLEPQEAFFVPQEPILNSFKKDMPSFQPPVPGHKYAIAWDISVASDPTVAYVIDVTKWPWEAVCEVYYEKPLSATGLVGEIFRLHAMFHGHRDANVLSAPTQAMSAFDATSMGGAVMRDLLTDLHPKRPINMAGSPKKKIQALTNLKNRLTKGEIMIPYEWNGLRQEVLNYRLNDKHIRQDRVMALMMADMVATTMAGNTPSKPINPHARVTGKRELRWR